MKTETQTVCELCFKISNYAKYELLEETLMMLEVLNVLKSNLTQVDNPMICSICVDKVKSAFHFKTTCIDAENNRISSKPTHLIDKTYSENTKECRLCTKFVGEKSVALLAEKLKENAMMEAFQKHILEIGSDTTENALLCESCEISMRNFSDFVGLISHFESENEKKYVDQFSNIEDLNKIGVVKDNTDMQITETKIKTEVMNDDDFYTLETKLKIECNAAFNDIETPGTELNKVGLEECNYAGDAKKMSVSEDDNTFADMNKKLPGGYVEFQQKNEEIDIKIEPEQSASGRSDAEETLLQNRYIKEHNINYKNVVLNDQKCLYQMPFKKSHQNSNEIYMHKCQEYDYQSEHISNVQTYENSKNTEMYKCQQCTYRTNLKANLKNHMIIHRNSKELQMQKCPQCTFQTKYKYGIKSHMLTHKNSNEVKEHRCPQCTYQSQFKGNLMKHMMIHRNLNEVEMHKCYKCPYQSKHKSNVRTHMLTHDSSNEFEMHKCPQCTYRTKLKGNLKNHMIIHKNSGELQMQKCPQCTYQTKHKYSIKNHMLTHETSNEVRKHKCPHCTYRSKLKGNLMKHMIIHKNSDEVEMHKCSKCTYETKHKSNVKTHMLTHDISNGLEMHKCQQCTYQTKLKGNLKKHMTIHQLK